MSIYKTGEETSNVLVWEDSSYLEPVQSEISYAREKSWAESPRQQVRSESVQKPGSRNKPQPTTPSPTIRRELQETNEQLRLASEAMLVAHDGEGVDVIELANAVQEYRQCVELLWRYRDFGMEAWRSVIVFCQQALCENMQDEEMSLTQCLGLKTIATGYLSNRLLAKDDVREVMQLLTSSSFDPMLFFSQPNQ
jgi:hypothetical protein